MRKRQSHSPQPREIPCHRRLGRVKCPYIATILWRQIFDWEKKKIGAERAFYIYYFYGIYIGKFCNLIQIFNNYVGTKCQTIVTSKKLCLLSFHKKIIVKNNNFATQKWRILRPGRIAWERLISWIFVFYFSKYLDPKCSIICYIMW